MKTCIMNTLIVIESLTIVNSLNKVQFPSVKVFPPQMLSSSSEWAIVQAVPIAFAPVTIGCVFIPYWCQVSQKKLSVYLLVNGNFMDTLYILSNFLTVHLWLKPKDVFPCTMEEICPIYTNCVKTWMIFLKTEFHSCWNPGNYKV